MRSRYAASAAFLLACFGPSYGLLAKHSASLIEPSAKRSIEQRPAKNLLEPDEDLDTARGFWLYQESVSRLIDVRNGKIFVPPLNQVRFVVFNFRAGARYKSQPIIYFQDNQVKLLFYSLDRRQTEEGAGYEFRFTQFTSRNLILRLQSFYPSRGARSVEIHDLQFRNRENMARLQRVIEKVMQKKATEFQVLEEGDEYLSPLIIPGFMNDRPSGLHYPPLDEPGLHWRNLRKLPVIRSLNWNAAKIPCRAFVSAVSEASRIARTTHSRIRSLLSPLNVAKPN